MPSIQFGYVNGAGSNDEVVVSPTDRSLTATQRRDLIVGAFQACNRQPLWVDGTPALVVQAIGTRLGIPVGKPDGWDPVPQDPAPVDLIAGGVAGEGVGEHEHEFAFDARQTLKMFGTPKLRRGKALTCTVEGCGAMQIRGRG